jgi:glycerol-3-phosphate dehydrogenase
MTNFSHDVIIIGGGIGTLTYTTLKYSDAHIDVYEQNDFCKE